MGGWSITVYPSEVLLTVWEYPSIILWRERNCKSLVSCTRTHRNGWPGLNFKPFHAESSIPIVTIKSFLMIHKGLSPKQLLPPTPPWWVPHPLVAWPPLWERETYLDHSKPPISINPPVIILSIESLNIAWHLYNYQIQTFTK